MDVEKEEYGNLIFSSFVQVSSWALDINILCKKCEKVQCKVLDL